MATAEDIAQQRSVQSWYASYCEQWGVPPDWEFRLRALASFCEFVGRTPDELVSDCLKDVEGGMKRIRAKRRRFYIEKIADFERRIGGIQGRNWGNAVRSFFIHNGVAMSADVLK